MDFSKYPSIPSEFWSYYQTLHDKRNSHPIVDAMSRQGHEKTLKALNELCETTCRNTGLKEKLFLNLGFDQNNFDNNHRSEEHTSELQSHVNLVCRLLLEKKKKVIIIK